MTKFKHGDRVTCEIEGKFIEDARISIDMSGAMYLCQSEFLTVDENADNMFGHSDRTAIYWDTCLYYYNVKLKEKTLDNLEVGDILVAKSRFNNKACEKKVLGICGLVYFLSEIDDFGTSCSNFTIQEIKEFYTLKQEEEPEEKTEEVTMAELEEELGRKVKIIK